MNTRLVACAFVLSGVSAAACGNDAVVGPLYAEQTGLQCQSVAQCYPLIDAGALIGTVTCMNPPSDGYCTHTCATDSDCCAVPGECTTGHPQVCSPFESNGATYCMLSCEAIDAGDPTAYCQTWASRSFVCASSGGGSLNRKVCKP
jgi:hypothetical protein